MWQTIYHMVEAQFMVHIKSIRCPDDTWWPKPLKTLIDIYDISLVIMGSILSYFLLYILENDFGNVLYFNNTEIINFFISGFIQSVMAIKALLEAFTAISGPFY